MILTYISLKSPSLCQRMLAWLVFIGVFNNGFALRLVPAACVRSPVSLYHTVISHQVGSCDLRFQDVQCRGLIEKDRKSVFTYPSTEHENNEATSVGFLFWSCTYYGGHRPLHVIIHSHLQDRLLRDFSFVLSRAQNPHLPENFLDDGGVLCGLLTLFSPDQSTILNHASLVVR